jgi:hypothetical protein
MKSILSFLTLALVLSPFCFAQDKPSSGESKDAGTKAEKKWTPLLSSDTLDGFEITNFGGEGEIDIKDGVLKLGMGDPLTGVTSKKKDFPTENYEMRWQARRVTGSDFFVGMTFPVAKEHCSFICGGWGGGLTGISSINGNDASENETSGFKDFKNGKWYSFRIRVDAKHVTVWIDDERIINVAREGKKFSLRAEVLKSRPLGYCVFQSDCEVKEWEYQTIE